MKLQPEGIDPSLMATQLPVSAVLPMVPVNVSPAVSPPPLAVTLPPAIPELGEIVRLTEPTVKVIVAEWPAPSLIVMV